MLKVSTLTAILFLLGHLLSAQTNYYVSPNGVDNASNGTLAQPWQTIQYAIDNVSSGDVVNVKAGTYHEKINFNFSNITLKNYNNDTVVVRGTGITSQSAVIEITDHSNITIDGLEIGDNIHLDAQGILVSGNAQNITIQNCRVHNIHFSASVNAAVNANTNAQAIIVYGTSAANAITNLKILNNEVYNCRLGYSEGIAVNGNVDGFEMSGNYVHDITNIGIDAIGFEGTCATVAKDQARNGVIKNNIARNCLSAYATSGGIYIDGAKNVVIENNVCSQNGYGIEIGCEHVGKSADSIFVRNNAFYNNQVASAALGGYDYPTNSGKIKNCSFTNNTCYANDYSVSANGELYLSYSENLLIENNIFYASTQNIIVNAELTQPSIFFDYNLIYSDADSASLLFKWNGTNYTGYTNSINGTSTNSHSTWSNPQFVNSSITTPDFHLLQISKGIDAGNPAFISALNEKDMDGESRINGIVDCGVDETHFGNSIQSVEEKNSFRLYPNPAKNNLIVELHESDETNSFSVLNSMGQIVVQGKLTPDKRIINIVSLPLGVYSLNLTTAGRMHSESFIKE